MEFSLFTYTTRKERTQRISRNFRTWNRSYLLILKEKESQKKLLEKIKSDPNLFNDKGEELINEFNKFKGKLVNFKNSKVMIQHNSTESTIEVADVAIAPISLNLLNNESAKDNANKHFGLGHDIGGGMVPKGGPMGNNEK